MTVGFDRTADCQGNHPSLTEFLRILTEHYWLCFDRTTSLTEHLGNLGFDRTVNGEMFCQKNVISRVFCHMYILGFFYTLLLFANICKFWDVGLDIDVEGIFHFEGGLGMLYLDEQSYSDLGTYSIHDCSIGTF